MVPSLEVGIEAIAIRITVSVTAPGGAPMFKILVVHEQIVGAYLVTGCLFGSSLG